ncbi:F-box protein At5g03100-like [Solanum pennellii]|uniref:F-box protein At5g03100-like n=1 Tax=Solanum pennellii TaxID=28526 RepID=A0ABM1UZV2_SOLPN|nr:F-box protein At5g03100-like [Solanum pennellii]XP_027769020.1 F-box protein At5g03100-like [Solanum pennellii]
MSNQDQLSGGRRDNGNSKSLLIENSSQKKTKIDIECEEIDRISQLPEGLIVRILSRLSIKEAFRTSILSKDWQYFWTSIDNIVYEEEYGRSDSSTETVHKFIFLTDNVLPLLSCSSIKKFILNIVFTYDNDVVSYFPIIDKWLEFATSKKVEDLCLNISYRYLDTSPPQPYSLPQVLCSSSSIVTLNCEYCILSEDCVLNWTSLKSSKMQSLYLLDEHIKQISNCPQLESLELHDFFGFSRLHMTSPKFRRLQLTQHYFPYTEWYSYEGDICCLEIVAPYVEHLTITGILSHTKIKLGDMPSLNHATFNLYCDEHNEMDLNIEKDLLLRVRCANELILSSRFIKVISNLMLEEEHVSLPLMECRCLTMSSRISKLSFPMLDNLLRSTHNLENWMIFPDKPYHPFFEVEDTDLPEDKYLSLEENIFKVFLQNLKNVKVMPFCSPKRRSDATELHQFLKFLLEHAINLEKLVIVPEHKECNSCSTNTSCLMKYLLDFPTFSISAIISLGPVSHNVFYNDV